MVNAFLDSDIIVDILRNYPPAVVWLAAQDVAPFGITPILWLEVVNGAPNREKLARSTKLLSRFQMVFLNEQDQTWAIDQLTKHRLSYGVGVTDCLIASVCHRLNLPLYTHNLKHFAPLLGGLAQQPY